MFCFPSHLKDTRTVTMSKLYLKYWTQNTINIFQTYQLKRIADQLQLRILFLKI